MGIVCGVPNPENDFPVFGIVDAIVARGAIELAVCSGWKGTPAEAEWEWEGAP